MSKVTLRPSTGTGGGGISTAGLNGAPSVAAAMSDANDGTYVTINIVNGQVTAPLMTQYAAVGAQRAAVAWLYARLRAPGASSVYGFINGQQVGTSPLLANVATTYQLGSLGAIGNHNAITSKIQYAGGAANIDILDFWVDVYFRREPAAPTITGPALLTQTTRTPNLTWTYNVHPDDVDISGSQSHFQLRIFTAAQAAIGGFDPGSSPATHDTGLVSSSSGSYVTPQLVNGQSYKFAVRTANTVGGVTAWGPWSLSNTITINVANSTPTAVVPANGATVTTGTPAVGAETVASGANLRREWQFATNNTFTANVFTVSDPAPGALQPMDTIPWPSVSTRLTQGTWYVRARVVDVDGITSNYSATNTFTVSHVPTVTNRQPSGGGTASYGTGEITLTWDFVDTDPNDYQTKYQVQMWKAGLFDTTLQNTGTVVSGDHFHTFSGLDATWKNVEIRWRVRVWDRDDVVAPGWVPETTFFLRDTPVPSISSPGTGAVINTPAPVIAWNYFSGSGSPQAQWKVDVYNVTADPDVLLVSSGWQVGTAQAWQVPGPVVAIGPTHSATVTVIDSVGLSGSDTNTFTATYVAPAAPEFTVNAVDYPTEAKREIEWSGASTSAGFHAWRVYRRAVTDTAWTLLAEYDTAGTRTYVDYVAPSQVPTEYTVTQVVLSFGSLIESLFIPSTALSQVLQNYMIVCPEEPELNMVLYHVKGDSFADEQEQATINLLGRGRRFEYGTRFGQAGTLEVSMRDVEGVESARSQRVKLEALRNSGRDVFLLNPFGDVWRCALPSVSVTRVPGVGLHEMMDVSIEFSEIGVAATTVGFTGEPPVIPTTAEGQWGGLTATMTRAAGTVVLTGNWGGLTATLGATPGSVGTTFDSILRPAGGKVMFGALTAPITGQGHSVSGLDSWESIMGRTPAIYHFYNVGSDTFFSTAHRNILERPGKPRMIAKYDWKPSGTWRDISNGSADAQLATAAAQMKDWPHKFFLTFYHEPDNDSLTGENTAADFVEMFRYCRFFLEGEGVTNAVYVLTFTGYAGQANIFDSMYPGDDAVDWIAYDPYAHSGYSTATGYIRYTTGTPGTYTGSNPPYLGFPNWAKLKAPGKPVMWSEWGIGGDCNNGITIINGIAAALQTTEFNHIRAIMHWNDCNTVNNEVTRISATGGTSGQFRFNYGGSFATLNYNSSASAAQTAIRNMASLAANSNRPAASVNVSGGPLNVAPLDIEWRNGLRGQNITTPTISNSTVAGATPTISTPTQGNPDNMYMLEVDQPLGGTRPSGHAAAMATLGAHSLFDIDMNLAP